MPRLGIQIYILARGYIGVKMKRYCLGTALLMIPMVYIVIFASGVIPLEHLSTFLIRAILISLEAIFFGLFFVGGGYEMSRRN